MKFQCRKTNGKLDINWSHIELYASRWKDGTVFDGELKRHKPVQYDSMRNYYFSAILPPFMKEIGYDPDEKDDFHKHLKITFFGVEPDERGFYRNKDIPSVFSKDPDVDQEQRIAFMEWVLRKAAEYGVYIEPAGKLT